MPKKLSAKKELTLSSGEKISVRTWPLRPGFDHIETARRIWARTDLLITDLGALKNFDVQKFTKDELDAVIQFIVDGSDLTAAEVEEICPAEFLNVLTEVIMINVRPTQGLLDRWTKFIAASFSPPQN